MRVGVIVPVHGFAPYLAEALDSVRSEEPDEVVVVDDGSPLPVPGATVRRAERGGPAEARAAGLAALGDCDLVALCDADDAWRPGRLRAQLEALGDFDVAVGRAEVIGPDGPPTGERWEAIPAGPFVPPFTSNPIVTSSVLLRHSALERAGGFASPFPPAEDWDLWLRLRAIGATFVSVPESVVAYRRRPGALSADIAALARAQMGVHERHAALASEEGRARARVTDLRALAAGLTRDGDHSGARAALREAGGSRARIALLATPGARRVLGRRDPYRARFDSRRRPSS